MASPTRIIVCGSRDWSDRETLDSELGRLVVGRVVGHLAEGVVLIHGACPFGGADLMVDDFLPKIAANFPVTVERFPPKVRGTAGFHARNQAMADAGAWLCIGFTNGRDPERGTWGTGDMFSRALAAGIPVRGVPGRKGSQ